MLMFYDEPSLHPQANTSGKEFLSVSPGALDCTVKRPKFGNGPLVRHPLSELLKNPISAGTEDSDLVQRGERLYIFF